VKILVLTTSSNNAIGAFCGSLLSLGEHDVDIVAYDQKYYQFLFKVQQTEPANLQLYQTGQRRVRRDDCAMDDEILHRLKLGGHDLVVYISAWKQDFCLLNETLGEMNAIAPVVHLLSDGADPPWWPELREYERRGVFTVTVNMDGSHMWPGGEKWITKLQPPQVFFPNDPAVRNAAYETVKDGAWGVSKALTLLTPIDVRAFEPLAMRYEERPVAVGYAGNLGNAGYGHRSMVAERLNRIVGFKLRARTQGNDYAHYADFLKHVRVNVDVPFSGSGAARQVKGRVVETGFAGAALLTWKNDAVRSWLTPRHHFWEYESLDELQEMAEWLAGHPKIAGESAAALNEIMVREHHPRVFWQRVFEACGK
jgi:hypothetical protein